MKTNIFALMVLGFAVLTGCSAAGDDAPGRESDEVNATADKFASVKAFYRAGAPEEDYAKALTPELASTLRKRAFRPGAAADFLCAQDFAEKVTFDEPVVGETEATIVVHQKFGQEDVPVRVTARVSDAKITGWTCDTAKHSLADARKVVQTFYGKKGPEDWSASPELDPELEKQLLDSDMGADPVLCAQDEPLAIEVGQAQAAGDVAVLTVTETFDKKIPILVEVDLETNKIVNIQCPWL